MENFLNIFLLGDVPNDLVSFTFFIGTMAMMAASVFFFLSLDAGGGKWRTSMLVSGLITFIAAVYIFYDSLQLGSIYGDILGFITALGLAVGAVTIRSAKKKNLVPAAVVGKLFVAVFAMFFIDSYVLADRDLVIVPLMCVMCVAIPFVMVTIAPRFIPAEEVNLFFLLETIIGPFWVWMVIKEQPSIETIQGGVIIILTIAIHSFLKLKKS